MRRDRLHAWRPSTKIILTTAVYVVAGVALVSLGLGRLADIRHHVSEVEASGEPAHEQLSSVETGLLSLEMTFERAARHVALIDRAAVLADAFRHNTESEKAWADFKREGFPFEDRRALVEKYEEERAKLSAVAEEAGVLLAAAADPLSPQVRQGVARMENHFDATISALDEVHSAVDKRVDSLLTEARSDADSTRQSVLIAYGVAFVITLAVAFAVIRATRRQEREVAVAERERGQESLRNEFEAVLSRALEMATTEGAAHTVVHRAIDQSAPGMPAELLLADASRAHFYRPVAIPDGETAPGCDVASPAQCLAARRGQTFVFPTSEALDSCPHLAARPSGPCSAVCSPVSIAGRTVGVVHVTSRDGEPPDGETVTRLQLVARKAGEQIGMLRAFARSETQAATDPLTGLLNRRSLENRARTMLDEGGPYAVLFGDLDRFKDLNDRHGHDAGDRALRVFARTMQQVLRPGDVAARYGGEEFVALLSGCDAGEAVAVAERIREALALAVAGGGVPPYTASFGVATSAQAETFADVIELADHALLAAKAAGRNRVLVAAGTNGAFDPSAIASPGETSIV